MRHSRHPSLAPLDARLAISPSRGVLALLVAAFLVFLTACTSTPQTPSPTATTAPTPSPAPTSTTAVPTPTGTPSGYVIKVYFSHHPESDSDPSKVLPVQRTSPDLGVATFALKQLFLGPTAQEQSQGYYSPFTGTLGSTNSCSDPTKDFTLALDHRGNTAETGTATVQLCLVVSIPGDLAGFRMSAVITQTLLQFSTIEQVVILNAQGNCFNDLKGGNACLNTSTPSGYVVKVYFSHHPESDSDPSQVRPVQRTSPDLGVATFALKHLFLGPTVQEQAQGYYSEFVGNLGTTNYCSDTTKDFTLSLDHRGSTTETGTATVKLCRVVSIPGDLSGARMKAMITQTLLQFSNIKRVVILNSQGNCFADLKGGNSCLNG